MPHIPPWLLVIIVLNIAIFAIVLNPNPFKGIPSIQNNIGQPVETPPQPKSNQSLNESSNKTLNQTSNQTLNYSIYTSACINSISNYLKNIENITSFTTIETRFFNKIEDSVNYARNWSSNSFELIGTAFDIYSFNKTNESVVAVNDFKINNSKNLTLPIVCDENGNIGRYSSCILTNNSNITIYCHNITEKLSECDIDKMSYDYWQDISYWITPKPGTLNVSQLFNFTINSSRKRLEYAFLNISYVRPPLINKNLFNQSQTTLKGDRLSITTTLNLTGKIYGGLILEASFKKKCYKYDIVAQYNYYD